MSSISAPVTLAETAAAIKIQAHYRGHLCREKLAAPTEKAETSGYLIRDLHNEIQSSTTPLGKRVGLVVALFFFVIPILLFDGFMAILHTMIRLLAPSFQKLLCRLGESKATFNSGQKLVQKLGASKKVRRAIVTTVGAVIDNKTIQSKIKTALLNIACSEATKSALTNLIKDPAVAESLKNLVVGIGNSDEVRTLLQSKITEISQTPVIHFDAAVTLHSILSRMGGGLLKTLMLTAPVPSEDIKNILVNRINRRIAEKMEELVADDPNKSSDLLCKKLKAFLCHIMNNPKHKGTLKALESVINETPLPQQIKPSLLPFLIETIQTVCGPYIRLV